MAVTKIINSLDSTTGWTTTSEFGGKPAFIIAVKGTKTASDSLDIDDITKITLGFGIDSGITNQPVIVGRVVLDFTMFSSDDESTNKRTALSQIGVLPSDIYIKVLGIQTRMAEYTEFDVPIEINILPIE